MRRRRRPFSTVLGLPLLLSPWSGSSTSRTVTPVAVEPPPAPSDIDSAFPCRRPSSFAVDVSSDDRTDVFQPPSSPSLLTISLPLRRTETVRPSSATFSHRQRLQGRLELLPRQSNTLPLSSGSSSQLVFFFLLAENRVFLLLPLLLPLPLLLLLFLPTFSSSFSTTNEIWREESVLACLPRINKEIN